MLGPRLAALALVMTSLALAATPGRASACATCGCGDPTRTTMGTGQPYAGRLRLGANLRYRWDDVGDEGVDRATVHEVRLDLAAAYAPTDWLIVAASLPVLYRDVGWVNGGHASTVSPGELELRARVVLLRDRAFAPRHLLGVALGLKLPTGIDQVTPGGTLLPIEAQPGSGTWDGIGGLFYTHLADPWAVFATAQVTVGWAGRYDESPGPSLRGGLALQYRFDANVTVRGGVDARWDAPATIEGQTDPSTEHVTLFASPDFLWSPEDDWLLTVGARIPVAQLSGQGRAEGWYFLVSAVVDLEAR
ncbi:MAG: transporter [Sandaracinaceae bacterium]|nr:transporter [Sandaracinaceae bacterium]